LVGEFSFEIFVLSPLAAKVEGIASNCGGVYHSESKRFSVVERTNENAIFIDVEFSELSSICVESDGYLSAFVIPRLPQSTASLQEFIFVVDCSGSMVGPRIDSARECLFYFLRSLPSNSLFNIFCFGSSFESVFESSVCYNDQHLREAVAYAEKMKADLGGTNLLPVLQKIFGRNSHCFGQLFIISDGEISNTDQVLKVCRSNSVKNRISSLGVGRGADAGLINGLAESTNGSSAFVYESDQIADVVLSQLSSSVSTNLVKAEVHIEGVDSFEVSPFPLPPIFDERPLTLNIKLHSAIPTATPILISGLIGENPFDIPIESTFIENFGVLSKLFGFDLINRLNPLAERGDGAARQRIIELSVANNLLSKFTSYIGTTTVQTVSQATDEDSEPPTFNLEDIDSITKELQRLQSMQLATFDQTMHMCYKIQEIVPFEIDEPATPVKNFEEHHPTPETTPQSTSTSQVKMDPLLRLINCQSASGCWSSPNEVCFVCSIDVPNFDDLLECHTNRDVIIATILGILMLERLFSDKRSRWTMIEQKALIFLQSVLQKSEIDSVRENLENRLN
jgi:hypothetical protein